MSWLYFDWFIITFVKMFSNSSLISHPLIRIYSIIAIEKWLLNGPSLKKLNILRERQWCFLCFEEQGPQDPPLCVIRGTVRQTKCCPSTGVVVCKLVHAQGHRVNHHKSNVTVCASDRSTDIDECGICITDLWCVLHIESCVLGYKSQYIFMIIIGSFYLYWIHR
jgi:hypothetical protein